jgi:hypothetical protein
MYLVADNKTFVKKKHILIKHIIFEYVLNIVERKQWMCDLSFIRAHWLRHC